MFLFHKKGKKTFFDGVGNSFINWKRCSDTESFYWKPPRLPVSGPALIRSQTMLFQEQGYLISKILM